jgi:adenylate cyclase
MVNKGKRMGRSCYASGNSYRVLQQRLAIIGAITRERGGTMEQSDELRDLTLRFYEAVNAGDLSFVERHVSRQEGAVFVGTDPDEWWEGYEAFLEAMRAQEEAVGGDGLQIVPEQIQAYREGSVGWVIDHDSFQLPDGTEVPFRNTMLFLQEDGGWKLVHAHASIGVSNEEMFGEDAAAS